MSITVNGTNVSLIHIRHDGRSYGIQSDELDVAEELDQNELLAIDNLKKGVM